jgi:ribosomal protein L44E
MRCPVAVQVLRAIFAKPNSKIIDQIAGACGDVMDVEVRWVAHQLKKAKKEAAKVRARQPRKRSRKDDVSVDVDTDNKKSRDNGTKPVNLVRFLCTSCMQRRHNLRCLLYALHSVGGLPETTGGPPQVGAQPSIACLLSHLWRWFSRGRHP